jgi:hypothetical protein
MPLLRNTTVVDFESLKGCFPNPLAVPSDIDGIVMRLPSIMERLGYFLVLECKHPQDPESSLGQKILLEQLARLPHFKVMTVFLSGKRMESGALKFDPVRWRNFQETGWRDGNIEDFRKLMHAWWEWVERCSK